MKNGEKQIIKRQRGCLDLALENNQNLAKAKENAQKEADLFRVKCFAKQVKDQPLKGCKVVIAK